MSFLLDPPLLYASGAAYGQRGRGVLGAFLFALYPLSFWLGARRR